MLPPGRAWRTWFQQMTGYETDLSINWQTLSGRCEAATSPSCWSTAMTSEWFKNKTSVVYLLTWSTAMARGLCWRMSASKTTRSPPSSCDVSIAPCFSHRSHHTHKANEAIQTTYLLGYHFFVLFVLIIYATFIRKVKC